MALLKAMKPLVTKKGAIIPSGATIKVKNPDRLIVSGKARELTRQEQREVLRAYLDFAKKVFG
ncbi:hypothetical protein [Syntrophorhabdus aromaticivorans]|uniref:hypothetical protein n=1 Tax=Syntrophorhabdus aromaticivorans TaxID=328301 RepID=UPI0004103397|nr:hypothetical protein [Syntrophorhabdus aromaticivorans]